MSLLLPVSVHSLLLLAVPTATTTTSFLLGPCRPGQLTLTINHTSQHHRFPCPTLSASRIILAKRRPDRKQRPLMIHLPAHRPHRHLPVMHPQPVSLPCLIRP